MSSPIFRGDKTIKFIWKYGHRQNQINRSSSKTVPYPLIEDFCKNNLVRLVDRFVSFQGLPTCT